MSSEVLPSRMLPRINKKLNFCFLDQLTVIIHALMAGLPVFLPFRVVFFNQLHEVFFGFGMGYSYKIIDIAAANLAGVFHCCCFPFSYLRQSLLQEHDAWSQKVIAVPKQSKFPSARWIDLIRSFFDSFQVSLTPSPLAFFSISESLILPPIYPLYTLSPCLTRELTSRPISSPFLALVTGIWSICIEDMV